MFGHKMKVIGKSGIEVILEPVSKDQLPVITSRMQSMQTLMYTNTLFAPVLESEEEWYEKKRKANDEVLWGICVGKSLIGITALHNLDLHGSCVSGIIIFDRNYWGKGVASAAHLARTLFAADFLNRLTIKSSVRTENEASLKALQRVGYHMTGKEPRTGQRMGRFLDTYHLCWLHPERISVLFPEGLPEEYAKSVAKAQSALVKARKEVEFL